MKDESIQFIYESYLRAHEHISYEEKDNDFRHPELIRELIEKETDTSIPTVVITGSKGKGSVANMISSIMGQTLRTGLLTSPHIQQFNERIRIVEPLSLQTSYFPQKSIFEKQQISDENLLRLLEKWHKPLEKIDKQISPTWYVSPMAYQVLSALTYFHEKNTQFNVLECGKGAAKDDVNQVPHTYAVMNSIFLEHTRELGSTLEEIAKDKSAVITENVKAAFVGQQTPEVMKILEQRAGEMDTRLYCYGRDFRAENIRYATSGMRFDFHSDIFDLMDVEIPLMGEHQARNAALALMGTAVMLRDEESAKEKKWMEQLRNGLRSTYCPGRQQILSADPFILLDSCIHEKSAVSVMESLSFLGITKASFIIAIPDDKDYLGVAKAVFSCADSIRLTQSHSPHYRFTKEQKDKLSEENIPSILYNEWEDAFADARKEQLPIILLGTTSFVAEVLVSELFRE